MNAWSKYIGRMFVLCLVLTIASVIALFDNRISGSEFVTLALGIPSAFAIKDAALSYIFKCPCEGDHEKAKGSADK
jgi:hypothetical protein